VIESGAATAKLAPIAFALDFPSVDEAVHFTKPLASRLSMVKVGLELFVAEGARAVGIGKELGVPVFLDLKLHDIPETVERAVARACGLGAKLLTVHASGGPAMLARAVERAKKEATGLEIVAVTVLTSLDGSDLAKIGMAGEPGDAAMKLAKMAWESGVTHFVCSPREVKALRAALGKNAYFVTPGIRPSSPVGTGDQKRTATAAEAIADGANLLVVGRPIRDAANPREVLDALSKECG
jgi:orotidine-5'-phosphate decarboxylase